MRRKIWNLAVVAAIGLGGTSAMAHGPAFDVSPAVESGKIVTNAFQDDLEFEVKNVRVFAYEFGEDPLDPYFLEDPGFHPLPGSGFAAGSLLGFRVQSAIQYWDGTGAVAFGAVPTGEAFNFGFGSQDVTVGSTLPAVSGFEFGVIDSVGEFDDHLNTSLLNGSLATPAEGIYLVTMIVTSDDTNLLPSEPIYLLFANGELEEQLEEAEEFAVDVLAPGSVLPVIPEPSAVGILAGGALLALKRRLR